MRRPLLALLAAGMVTAGAAALAGCATGSVTDTTPTGATYESSYTPVDSTVAGTSLPVTVESETTNPAPSTPHRATGPATSPASSASSQGTAAAPPRSTTAAPPTSTSAAAPTRAPSVRTSAAPARTAQARPSSTAKPTSAVKPSSTPAKPKPSTSSPASLYTPIVARQYGTGNATQLITVSAPSSSSTTATLSAWKKTASKGWVKVAGFDALPAHVGGSGIGQANENIDRTPAGSFTLTQAFGLGGDPGTDLPYFKVRTGDWWVGDAGKHYNTHVRDCGFCTSKSEKLWTIWQYDQAVLIDYNTPNAPGGVHQGAGSAFFLHVTDGGSTGGCVSIAESKLVALMKWLDPAKHPRIVIGVL